MKERPILFSGPMVGAILNDSKTQTRRIVKPQPSRYAGGPVRIDGQEALFTVPDVRGSVPEFATCPYGKPGDRIWVKETHRFPTPDTIEFRADGVTHHVQDNAGILLPKDIGSKWRPSLFMWRWASRITLEVTGVRVERLQDISEEDASAEGIIMHEATLEDNAEFSYEQEGFVYESATEAYRYLWESINGPGSWDKNPWVWVVTFKRIEP